jgi:hypothetical protein
VIILVGGISGACCALATFFGYRSALPPFQLPENGHNAGFGHLAGEGYPAFPIKKIDGTVKA